MYTLKKSGLSVSLTKHDFLAEGGEAKVYAKNGVAYKIGKAIPEGKIDELSLIKTRYILAPEEIILLKSKPVGYTMPLAPVSDTWAFPLCCTNTFWQRENITTDQMLKLVLFLREQFDFIHKRGCLIVDANPFNFLIEKTLLAAYFIDVNSYATKNYPATAIMASVKDHHTKGFSAESDWFSFGLLTFELLVGLHGFRSGSCRLVSGDKDAQMNARMQQNLSVLNSQVKFPKSACRPFTSIPTNWLDWYKAEFEQGKRCPPPTGLTAVTPVAKLATIRDSVKLNIKSIFTACEDINGFEYVDGNQIVKTKNYVYINGHKYNNSLELTDLFYLDRRLHSIYEKIYNVETQQPALDWDLKPNGFCYNHQPFYINGDNIQQINLHKTPKGDYRLLTKVVARILGVSKVLGDNFLAQNLGGSNYLLILDDDKSYNIRIKELDGAQIFAGYGFGKIQIIWARKNNVITKNIIEIGPTFTDYAIQTEHIDYFDYQAVMLDTGVLVETTSDGNLSLTRGFNRRIIEDKWLNDQVFTLGTNGSKVLISRDANLYEISLK